MADTFGALADVDGLEASEDRSEVLRRRAGPRLVLVTCGGPFDESRRTYRDNLVVHAVPA